MQIGILGAGNIGGTLARRLAEHGHSIFVGVRDPASPKAQAVAGAGVRLGSLAEAAAFGEVVIVALPLDAALAILPALDLAGKILIDTTNAFGGAPAGFGSAAAAVAHAAGGARIAKAFNATPWEVLADPIYGGVAVETFICGDDPPAKQAAIQLAHDLGVVPVDVGGIASAPLTENFARFWGLLAYQAGYGRGFAFKMLTR